MLRFVALSAGAVLSALSALASAATPPQGYFRQPAISANSMVFVAEGDLWRAGLDGGSALRLTTHHGEESYPAISPDGKWLAFSARYEGPEEVYVMPLAGGAPTRLTYAGDNSARVQGWADNSRVLYAAPAFSGNPVLRQVDINTRANETVPLSEAAEACTLGGTLFFTRLPRLGDNVKGYVGGRAQKIWAFDRRSEAVNLTADFAGTSRQPMCGVSRVYFLSDRDGTMNI
jgi:tricorn protease